MKLLTPEEVLQAIKDGKQVELNLANITSEWEILELSNFTLENLIDKYYIFCLKPNMITIGDVSFPKSITEKLPWQTVYYYPSLEREELYNADMWG